MKDTNGKKESDRKMNEKEMKQKLEEKSNTIHSSISVPYTNTFSP